MDEHQQRPRSQPSVWIALCIAIGVSLAAGVTVTTLVGVSDSVVRDTLTTLTRQEPPKKSTGDLVIVLRQPTGVGRGMQLALFGLLVGGVPAAILSATLVAFRRKSRRPWAGQWGNVFLAGLVFQLSSLGLTTILVVLLVWYAVDSSATAADVLPFGAFLGLSVLCGAAAVRFWRELQDSVHDGARVDHAAGPMRRKRDDGDLPSNSGSTLNAITEKPTVRSFLALLRRPSERSATPPTPR